jgi:tetratricopeptide (TPR) repeat protein
MVFVVAPPAGPTPAQIDRWIEDLGADDGDTWRPASEHLWKAGKAAEPALRAAKKHRDPDVVLRAILVLSRFEWGIYPDTPAAVVKLIERYRDGERSQRQAAVADLVRQGRPGYVALQRLLAREPDAAMRQYTGNYLRQQYRPIVRDLLATGDRAGAVDLLEVSAAAGSDEAVRDLAALWVQTGQAAAKARELERMASGGDRKAVVRGTYLHRGNGDLATARRLAERAGDEDLLAGILVEQEDYKSLARNVPAKMRTVPAQMATLWHRAGDREGFEAWLRRIPAADHSARARVLFFNGRPGAALDEDRKTGALAHACRLLALQGRRREALALSPDETKEPDQRVYLLLEQAVLYHQVGEKDRADKLLTQALQGAEKALRNADYLLGGVLRAAGRMNRRKEMLAEVAKALDRMKPASIPRSVLYALSERHSDLLEYWWEFLRRREPDALPSAILARLAGWFEQGKADPDFDTLVAEAQRGTTIPATERLRWPAVLARTCLVLGKQKKAEEILRTAARAEKTAAACSRLADFYLERRRWSEAAQEYGRALEYDRADPLALYLRGVALTRVGQVKEGQALTDLARLLPLADEAARYRLARGLGRHGLRDEADAEWLVMARTAPFFSIYISNGVGHLAARALRQNKPREAARWYRLLIVTHALGGGAFLDETADVAIPARAHLYQARGLLAVGKLDEALADVKRLLEHLPEEIDVVTDLVRALDRRKRRADADRLFEGVHAGLQKACSDFPKSAGCHNRLAWLLARCGRRLDSAVKHARTATTLGPGVPGYLDTLAEAHFQRGDRAEAVALMKRAVTLAPGRAYFKAQLRRMEAGDPAADLPEE